MIDPGDELGVMLHVSVSDVAPQVDHAARALHGRRRHAVAWTSASAGFLVGALVVTMVVAGAFSAGPRTPAQVLAGQRWQHPVHLDANRLLIEPPTSADHVSLTREETLALLQSSENGSAVQVVAARWGRVSVRDTEGLTIAGFDKQTAWAVVFRTRDDSTTCPMTSAQPDAVADPGDYTGVQVLVVAGTATRLLYSQTGSWSCGLPAQPIAQLPENAG